MVNNKLLDDSVAAAMTKAIMQQVNRALIVWVYCQPTNFCANLFIP